MSLTAIDELCVQPDRDVVEEDAVAGAADVDPPLGSGERGQRADRVAPVEPEIAGEVIARAEGDDDERKVALDRDPGDRAQRSVPARDSERFGVGTAGKVGRIVVGAENSCLDAPGAGLRNELFRARLSARAWVDEEEAPQVRVRP
jgi:hypothetical protein